MPMFGQGVAVYPPGAILPGRLAWHSVRRRLHQLRTEGAPPVVAWQQPRSFRELMHAALLRADCGPAR